MAKTRKAKRETTEAKGKWSDQRLWHAVQKRDFGELGATLGGILGTFPSSVHSLRILQQSAVSAGIQPLAENVVSGEYVTQSVCDVSDANSHDVAVAGESDNAQLNSNVLQNGQLSDSDADLELMSDEDGDAEAITNGQVLDTTNYSPSDTGGQETRQRATEHVIEPSAAHANIKGPSSALSDDTELTSGVTQKRRKLNEDLPVETQIDAVAVQGKSIGETSKPPQSQMEPQLTTTTGSTDAADNQAPLARRQRTDEEEAALKKQANQLEAIRRMRLERESQTSTDAHFLQQQRSRTPSRTGSISSTAYNPHPVKQASPAKITSQSTSEVTCSDSSDLREIQKQRLQIARVIRNTLHFSGRLSSLSIFDMGRWGELQTLLKEDSTLTAAQKKELNDLAARIITENLEFRKTEDEWISGHRAVYDYTPQPHVAWFKAHIAHQRTALFRDRKQHFRVLSQIALCEIAPHDSAKEDFDTWVRDQLSLTPQFQPIMVDGDPMVYKTGHVLHLQPKPRMTNVPFDVHHNPLSSGDGAGQDAVVHPKNPSTWRPSLTSRTEDTPRKWKNKSVPSLSEDSRALQLAAQHQVDILTTASALECIASSAPTTPTGAWEIPVCCVNPESSRKKVIILEKPLPQKKYSPKSANRTVLKHLARSMITHLDHPTMNLSGDSAHTAIPSNTNAQAAALPSDATTQSHSTATPQTSSDATTQSHSTATPQTTAGDRTEGVAHSAPERVKAKGEGSVQSACDTNLVYALWAVGDYRFLVRMSLAGYIQETQTVTRIVAVSAKPEYLPSCQGLIGPEEETPEELARWWVRTLLRPNALLLLARCDMIHNTMRFEVRDVIGQTTQQGAELGEMTWAVKRSFATVFRCLSGLTEGEYLLAHDNAARSMKLWIACSEQDSTYDLHNAHTGPVIDSQIDLPALHTANIPLFKTFEGNPWPPGLFPPSLPLTVDEALPKLPKRTYCYAFAREGMCPVQQCPYKHVVAATLIQMAEQAMRRSQGQRKTTAKPTRKKKKAKAKTNVAKTTDEHNATQQSDARPLIARDEL